MAIPTWVKDANEEECPLCKAGRELEIRARQIERLKEEITVLKNTVEYEHNLYTSTRQKNEELLAEIQDIQERIGG